MSQTITSASVRAVTADSAAERIKEKTAGREAGRRIGGYLHRAYKVSIAIIIFLLIWEFAPRLGIVNPMFITPFSIALSRVGAMALSGKLFVHLGISLARALTGFGVGLVVGFPLGILVGLNKNVREYANPLLTLLGQTSPFALFPMFIVLFGIGELSKVTIVFWGCVWPILLNTVSGVAHVDPVLVKAAKTMGANGWTVLWRVLVPAAMPEIFPGLRLSVSTSVLMLVAAEMLGAKDGLGFLIYHAKHSFDIPEMYAAIIVIAILGVVLNQILNVLEHRVLAWKNK